jgi:predicted patatin/cPLA2 family phospholipase
MELKPGSQLIKNLLLKKELLKKGEDKHKQIRTLLLILSGANRGAYGAGAAIALHLLGLGKVFDTVVGISTGAGIGGFFLAGKEQMILGASVYYTEFCAKQYISYSRLKKIVDVNFISDTLRRGRATLNQPAIRQSRSEFFTGATNPQTGKGDFLNAKRTNPDIITAMEASWAMPLGYNPPISINGKAYFDGNIAFPFPLKEACKKFQPTDVLVLPNRPMAFSNRLSREKIAEKLLAATYLRHFSKSFLTALATRHERFLESVDFAEKHQKVNIGILWPPNLAIHQLSKDSRRIRKAVDESVKQTLKLFGQPDIKYKLI